MSFFSLYKPGQGKWVRGLSAVGIGLLVAFGVYWLLEELKGVIKTNTEYWLGGIAVLVVAFFGLMTWWILNKPKVGDFMIATESEMRKVNWPTRKEIIGSTWVVIAGTFLIALILFVVDFGFTFLFRTIRILDVD